VKWKGYPITEATWENESAFSNNGDMIQAYKDRPLSTIGADWSIKNKRIEEEKR
jgi:Chromo (CHRromatin Organisation MOdifier) domain